MRIAWLFLLFAACGGPSGAFRCFSDEECTFAGQDGTCQADGWCSFADPSCDSGWRYGEFAGDGLGRACVPTVAERPDAAPSPEDDPPDAGPPAACGEEGDVCCQAEIPCTGQLACLDSNTCGCAAPLSVHAGVLSQHTCAIHHDRRMWCWGYDEFGQVGNGGFGGHRNAPQLVVGLTGVDRVAVGGWHTCALAGGAVYCWGDNDFAQLSLPDGDRDQPEATGLTGIVDLSGGATSVCAIDQGGEVLCWGRNNQGQLGDGTTTDRRQPRKVTGVGGATQVSAGSTFSCARTSAGLVFCWGAGDEGQLGDGQSKDSLVPVQVRLDNVLEVAVGDDQACARRSDGSAWCWGDNEFGTLGDGTNAARRATPVQVDGLSDVVEIHVADEYACARRGNGTIACWGRNTSGELGNGATANAVNAPVDVAGVTGATSLALGQHHACATTTSGILYCWGEGAQGQLGDDLGLSHLNATPAALGCPP